MNTTDVNHETAQFSEGIQEILGKILDPKIKIVSFDIFDTLLFRPVSTPADIFRLLENKLSIPNFHNMRVTAEAEARRYNSMYTQEITLEDIYEMYKRLFGASESEVRALMQEELEIEYTLLYARKSAKYLYEQALSAGKEVVIISDMYLSSQFLDKCLAKNGYTGHSRIYVSSETGVLKSSKMMFELVLSEVAKKNVLPSEVLHIGDNKKSDVDSAIATGMNAAHLPKPIDIRNDCKQLKRLYTYILGDVLNSNNAMLYGVLLNLYFDDPFVSFEKDSFFNGNARLMGYWFAPLMVAFSKWMIECVEKEKIEQLLFVWRDGYLPLKLFETLRPLVTDRSINVESIYMGRALRMPFQALDRNGFFATFADYPLRPEVTVDFFIKKRLFCEDEEQRKEILNIFFRHGYIDANAPIENFEKYRGFLHELEPYFVENSKKKIERYSKYVNAKVDQEKKVAIFDRSPRGKSSRFLKQYFDIESSCFTTEIYDTPKAKLEDIGLSVFSYLEYGSYYINKMGRVWAMLFERIISDTRPGFDDIVENNDGTVSVVLDASKSSELTSEADDIIRTVQDAIVEFAHQISSIFGKYFRYMNIDRHGVFDYAIEVLANPHYKDADLIVKINPDKSTLAPIDENTFINWYNMKLNRSKHKIHTEKNLFERIKLKGYLISEQLGILPQARAVYRFIVRKPQNPQLSYKAIQEQTDMYISRLKEVQCENIDVLLVGGIPVEEAKFFNALSRLNKDYKYLLVAAGFLRKPTCFDFPCLEAPDIFSFWGIEGADRDISIPAFMKQEVDSKKYLSEVVEQRVLKGYSRNMAILLAFEGERYFREVVQCISPKILMVWNNWGNNSVIPARIAEEFNIPVLSVERGFIEGTIMLSVNGYGEDEININPDRFCNLPVNHDELEQAENIIKFLKDTGFNRYQRRENNCAEVLKEKINNKANILVLGSFDCENPAFPYSEMTERYYSPLFNTSKEMIFKIAEIAKRQDWNVLYKPHPLMDKMTGPKEKRSFPKNVQYIRNADINELIDVADVVVCMVSGTAYVALTRGKPLVQLAYTTLKEKGCCYEVQSVNEIGGTIQRALERGFTIDQQKAFTKHVAQINKYYYFDDLSVRPIRYGRSIEDALQLIQSTINE